MSAVREALEASKAAVSQLVCAIEQHHASSLCASEALFGEADRHYRTLDLIRAALEVCE